MTEPIRDTCDVQIVLNPTDRTDAGSEPTPWIGLIHELRTVVRPVLFVPHRDFDRVWTLALSGHLRYAHLFLTKPHYRSAFVVNPSLSTHPEE
jgi:hypothetical protein